MSEPWRDRAAARRGTTKWWMSDPTPAMFGRKYSRRVSVLRLQTFNVSVENIVAARRSYALLQLLIFSLLTLPSSAPGGGRARSILSEVEVLRSGVSGAKPPSKARRDLQRLFRSFRNSKLHFAENDKLNPYNDQSARFRLTGSAPSLRSGSTSQTTLSCLLRSE